MKNRGAKLIEKIMAIKKRNAVIITHNYQLGEL